ncbi:hypothetical protein [Streptomyces sp. NPDC001100]
MALAAWPLSYLSQIIQIIVPVLGDVDHRFEVTAAVPESGDAVSVHDTGRRLDRLTARRHHADPSPAARAGSMPLCMSWQKDQPNRRRWISRR